MHYLPNVHYCRREMRHRTKKVIMKELLKYESRFTMRDRPSEKEESRSRKVKLSFSEFYLMCTQQRDTLRQTSVGSLDIEHLIR